MLIENLGRHLAIGSRREAESLAAGDSDFWNVISLIGPSDPEFPAHQGAKAIHTERFEDIEDPDDPMAVRGDHIKRIFSFFDQLDYTEPILVHCAQGLSRSPAVTLGIVARSLYLDGEDNPVPDALEIVLQLRPIAAPNLLVARIAFEQFFTADDVETSIDLLRNDERIQGNQFHRW